MLSVSGYTAVIVSALPFTVITIPGGLPITMDTGCFARQVLLCPARIVPWKSCLPLGLVNPIQQFCIAVTLITATGGTGLTAGLTVLGCAVGLAVGRCVAALLADGEPPRVETRW